MSPPGAASTSSGSAGNGRTSFGWWGPSTRALFAPSTWCGCSSETATRPLGDAIAAYGRIFKSLHLLAYVDDEAYRRAIKGMRNLQEGRHAVAEKIFHGRKGRVYKRYHEGMEDQLGTLGLVLNCVVLWNTFYIDAVLERLRAAGHPVLDEDVARLSPFISRHRVQGHYYFSLPEMPAGVRELRDPDTPDDEGEEDD